MDDKRDFIEVTPAALAAEACAAIVARMRASEAQLQAGQVGGGVYPELKKSRDLAIGDRPEWADVAQALNVAVYGGLLAYLRKYPQALIAPLILLDRYSLAMFMPAASEALQIARHLNHIAVWSFLFFGVTFVVSGVVRSTGAVVAPLLLVILFIH